MRVVVQDWAGCFFGIGVKSDRVKARQLLKMACNNGYTKACKCTATHTGRVLCGVAQDRVVAHRARPIEMADKGLSRTGVTAGNTQTLTCGHLMTADALS